MTRLFRRSMERPQPANQKPTLAPLLTTFLDTDPPIPAQPQFTGIERRLRIDQIRADRPFRILMPNSPRRYESHQTPPADGGRQTPRASIQRRNG